MTAMKSDIPVCCAAAFLVATGYLAPGKDIPAVMMSDEYLLGRAIAWEAWRGGIAKAGPATEEALRKAARAVLDELENDTTAPRTALRGG